MLGRKGQNKPNGFSIYVVLRSGAEISRCQRFDETKQTRLKYSHVVLLIMIKLRAT